MKKLMLGKLLFLLALTSGALGEESRQLVGRVIDIDGRKLMTNRMTESSWFQAYMEMSTFLKERLQTDEHTTATIQFTVNGRSVIAPGTQVEIDTVGSTRVMKVKSGTVWAKFDKQEEEFQIKTAGGVMGIEGTEFFVEADEEGETTLTVIEGKVRVQSGDQEQVVTDGEEANFRRGVKQFRPFAKNMTLIQRRQAAFKKLGIEGKPFAQYIRARGLARKKRRFLSSLFFAQAARRQPPRNLKNPPGRPPRPRRMPQFEIRTIDQAGLLSASWTPTLTRSYAVLVSTDEDGEEALWHGKSNSPTFQYPQYGPPLEEGVEYYLSVTPLRPDESPFRNKQGEEISAQKTFKSAGHEPVYSELTGVVVNGQTGPPRVSWPEQREASGYFVRFTNESETVWSEESKKTDYTFPLSARALEPGDYQVVVESYDESGFKMAESDPVTFHTEGWSAEGLEGPTRE